MKTERRSAIKKLFTSAAALLGVGYVASAKGMGSSEKEVGEVSNFQDVPIFSGHTIYNNMVYISGKGAQVAPLEIKAHTEIVLQDMEQELIKAGSSMEKVLKVSVFLDDIANFKGMNEVYAGRFGKRPPVRTTVAVAKGGLPGVALVEMDCIAYI
jgi:enamine deaminase RidA (YjgF/YER057c/UK114 family)